MAPKHSAEVMSSVPKHRKAVVCLRENIRVLEKLHASMSDRASVNESTTYVTRGSQEPFHEFPLGATVQCLIIQAIS